MSKPALPTIGRVVYWYPADKTKERAAIVADVDDYTVNLSVVNHDGSVAGLRNVPHVSLGQSGGAGHWDWMPFQKGQQAKTEELEKALAQSKKFAGSGPT